MTDNRSVEFLRQSITHVEVHPSVKVIKSRAFYHCLQMTAVILGKGLGEISKDAFGECTSLHEITIPHAVKMIKDTAFMRCSQMKTVILGEGLEEIGEAAFC
jgi:hypothetical protein